MFEFLKKLVRKPSENELRGVVFNGYGMASKALKFQFPSLGQYFPDLLQYQAATVNVLLSKPVHFNKYDVITPMLQWHPQFNSEQFCLSRASVRVSGKVVDAIIYVPSASPHTPCAHKLELILREHVPGLSAGQIVEIHFPNKRVINTDFAMIVD